MRLTGAVIIGLIAATFLSNASAQERHCQMVRASGASLLQVCGDHLNAFSLSFAETKIGTSGVTRAAINNIHGYFSFECPIKPICDNEPALGGFFVDAGEWQRSSKDQEAIQRALLSAPIAGISRSGPSGQAKDGVTATCPMFDVSLDDMVGKAGCFTYNDTKDSFVAMVVADDHVAFVLTSYFPDQSGGNLQEKTLQLMPRLKIARATGDVALLGWMH